MSPKSIIWEYNMSGDSDKAQNAFPVRDSEFLYEDDDPDSTSAIMALGNLWVDSTTLPTGGSDHDSTGDSSGDGGHKTGSTFQSRLDSYKEQLRSTAASPKKRDKASAIAEVWANLPAEPLQDF
jgi:hypothetical protein